MSVSPGLSSSPTGVFAPSESSPQEVFERDSPPPRKKHKFETFVSQDGVPRLRSRKKLAIGSPGHQPRPKMPRQPRPAGLLKKLAYEAPLDILLEIFSYVSLEDLFSLSRSSKSVRSLLMNKNQAGTENLWARAREAIPRAPSKPGEMTDPIFARLLFDTSCMVCTTDGARYFSVYQRLCDPCLHAHASFNPGETDHWSLLAVTWTELGVDRRDFTAALLTYYVPVASPTNGAVKRGRQTRILRNHITLSARHSQTEVESLLASLRSLPGEVRKTWLGERAEATKMKEKFIYQYQQWDRNENPRKTKLRLDDILDRLRILGWDEELTILERTHSLYRLEEIPGIVSTDRLTDVQWSSLRPKVIGFLVKTRSERLSQELKKTRVSRLEILTSSRLAYRTQIPPDTLVPPVIDLALLPPFMEVIERKDVLEAGAIRALFDELFQTLFPEVANEWLNSIHKTLLLKETGGSEGNLHPVSILYQARATVSCQTCGLKNMRYPQVLYHPCGRNQFSVTKKKKGEDIPPIEKAFTECLLQDRPSHRRTLSLNLDTTGPDALILLELCELDPENVSYADIMQANPLFECTTCNTRIGRFMMNYPSALTHRSKIHPTRSRVGPPQYRLMTDSDFADLGITKKIFDRGPAILRSLPYTLKLRDDGCSWLCRHCGIDVQSTQRTIRHLCDDHNVKVPQEGEDYMMNHENTSNAWQEWEYRHSVRKRNAGQ
ncbi:hypothetical protein DL96DRAFT_602973 [Flagelloscypha sp. PMI_526]|nr:hypothetical protein DL96DRAFT_602973 [Flagelloscypha sp. PMI_526]